MGTRAGLPPLDVAVYPSQPFTISAEQSTPFGHVCPGRFVGWVPVRVPFQIAWPRI
jgi:hypothetical protein